MVIFIEELHDELKVSDNYNSTVEEFLAKEAPQVAFGIPQFYTERSALLWTAYTLLSLNLQVIFRSRRGNDRVMNDIREMTFEAVNARKKVGV